MHVPRIVIDNQLARAVRENTAAGDSFENRLPAGLREAVGIDRPRICPDLFVVGDVVPLRDDRRAFGGIGAQSAGVIRMRMRIDDVSNGLAGNEFLDDINSRRR